MRRFGQGLLLMLAGGAVLRISLLSELYLRYVKEGLRLPLVVSGAVLLLLGVCETVRAASHGDGPGADHGHDHSHLPRSAWLLLLPVLLLLLHAPPPLGAFTAARESAKAPASAPRTPDRQVKFAPLPAGDPVPMPLSEFTLRAQHDRRQSLRGRTVRMTGFVTPDRSGAGGWRLTRLVISCCAADSQSVTVRMRGAAAPPADTWVTVTGRWSAAGTLGTPSAANELRVESLAEVERPASPYTDTVARPPG
ncbi:TIGR03943 family putative permease subunit [Streptomyces polyrhachis]|uniref:TIGR03943 family putative permease subunit n=1 Tax=Streptomyces polyrhachis TaxID=1282885 RepID=A0ABW2GBE5_9ACTN